MTFTLDHAGNKWAWNCGWQLYRQQKDTTYQPTTKPIGHLAFKRSIRKLNLQNDRQLLHGMDRPSGSWRRIVEIKPFYYPAFSHPLYGTVKLLATDGHRAIIEERDGMRIPVIFANLTELVRNAGPLKSGKRKTTQTRTKKSPLTLEQQLAKLGLTL